MATTKVPPWKRKRPNKKPTKLSEADKARARARAARAGRRYPNLVDNMWAASSKKSKTSTAKKTAAPKKKTAKASR